MRVVGRLTRGLSVWKLKIRYKFLSVFHYRIYLDWKINFAEIIYSYTFLLSNKNATLTNLSLGRIKINIVCGVRFTLQD